MPRRISVLALVCAIGCGSVKDAVNDFLDDGGDTGGVVDLEERLDVPAPTADVGVAPSGPLEASTRRYPFPAKGGANVGFRIDALAGTYALAGTVEVPSWSVPHDSDPELVRDDDLDTSAICTAPRGAERCVIAIRFPAAATLEAVRLFAAGPRYEAYPRPKRLRIHTAEGFIEALLPDTNTHVYAVFGKDIVSSFVAVEVIEMWPGESDAIHIAELDVFGTTGEPREPLQIDPDRTFVRVDEPIWTRGSRDTYDRESAFIHRIDAEGKAHRFVEGTALRGRAGDRLLVVEHMQSVSGCGAPRGTFYLVDTQTRLVAPLGEFGGVGGDVYRATDGRGVAVGFVAERGTVLDGLFVDDSAYHRKRTPLRPDKRAEDFLGEWGLERTPLQRGATPLAKSSCVAGNEALLLELATVRVVDKKRKSEPETPEQWRVCELGEGARAFLTDHGPCGAAWEVHVLDAKGGLVDSIVQPRAGAHLGVRDLGSGALLVQAAGSTDSVSLLTVSASGIDTLAESASLVLEPPAECRSVCDAGFRNPHAPDP